MIIPKCPRIRPNQSKRTINSKKLKITSLNWTYNYFSNEFKCFPDLPYCYKKHRAQFEMDKTYLCQNYI